MGLALLFFVKADCQNFTVKSPSPFGTISLTTRAARQLSSCSYFAGPSQSKSSCCAKPSSSSSSLSIRQIWRRNEGVGVNSDSFIVIKSEFGIFARAAICLSTPPCLSHSFELKTWKRYVECILRFERKLDSVLGSLVCALFVLIGQD